MIKSKGVDFNISREEVRRRIYKAFLHLRNKFDKFNRVKNRNSNNMEESKGYNTLRNEINKLDEEEQYKLVFNNPRLIEMIENPSNKLLKLAVNTNPRVIKHIKNPSLELLDIARERDPLFFDEKGHISIIKYENFLMF